MFSSPRRSDDADVIRARLRALLDEGTRVPGWLPEDEDDPSLITELHPPRRAVPAVPIGAVRTGPAQPATRGRPAGRTGAAAVAVDDSGTVPVPADGAPTESEGTATETGSRSLPSRLPDGLGRHRRPGAAARVDPGRRGAWAMWVVAVLAALGVAGWSWLDRPQVDPVLPDVTTVSAATASAGSTAGSAAAGSAGPSGAPAMVVVSVVGQVHTPGLVTLPAGARVADAVAGAGGLLPEADPGAVNLAAVVVDGQQIAVGVPGAAAAPAPGPAGSSPAGLLDLNTATVADLDALPGIGPVLAQRIVDHRTAEGPFTSVDQLDDVDGIGPAIFERLSALVSV